MQESSTPYETETHVPSPPDFTDLPLALTREDDPSAWTTISLDAWFGKDDAVRWGAHEADWRWIRFGITYPSTKNSEE